MKRRFTKAWKGDSHCFLRQLQTIPLRISQSAIDCFNVVADCCCKWKLGDLKSVLRDWNWVIPNFLRCNWPFQSCCWLLLRSETRRLEKDALAIGNSESKVVFYWKGSCYDRKFSVISLHNGADCWFASLFIVSFRKGWVIGGKHVSTMHGEEWNNDDDNIKNSPCQINFFLFPLYHALLSLLYCICLPVLAYYVLSTDLGLIFQSCLPYSNFYLFTAHFYDICMSLRLMPLYPTRSNFNNHHALTRPPWANGYFLPCLVALLYKLTTPGMWAKYPEVKIVEAQFLAALAVALELLPCP